MGKRKEETPDNLVMLLDTMCNLLGGLILISILLALVSQAAGPTQPPPEPPGGDPALTNQVSVLTSQIASLTNQIAQVGTVTNPLSLAAAKAGLAAAEAANAALQVAVEKRRAEKRAKQEEWDRWRKKVINTEKELADLTHRSRVVRVPWAHETTNRVVLAALLKGTLYTLTDVSRPYRAGEVRPLDRTSADVKIESDPNGMISSITFEPKGGLGQPIQKGAETGGALRRLLENVNPAAEYITMAVYPDSYSQFNYVKALIISNGFEYSWQPMKGNEPIVVYPGNGTSL